MKVTHWKLKHIFQTGNMVRVVEDAGLFTSLKGKIGTVLSIPTNEAVLVVDFPGLGMRRVTQRRLAPVDRLAAGTKVKLASGPLVVGSYVPEGDSYLLFTYDPNLTIAASAALVCAADA